MIKKIIKKTLSLLDYEIRKKVKIDLLNEIIKNNDFKKNIYEEYKDYFTLDDLTVEESEKINSVKKYTMTGPLRMMTLIRSVEYIINNKIEGDFVECGVWKGGSMMLIAKTLIELGVNDRNLYLYDTFEGMVDPQDLDVSFDNKKAKTLLQNVSHLRTEGNNIWCYSSLEEVKQNLISTGYNPDRIFFIKGKVEDTIPNNLPSSIALLRLDTDWYQSTIHELTHLYPLLIKNGILIIDDYGQWMGQKKAVDEYIKKENLKLFLNRIDFSSRLVIKSI